MGTRKKTLICVAMIIAVIISSMIALKPERVNASSDDRAENDGITIYDDPADAVNVPDGIVLLGGEEKDGSAKEGLIQRNSSVPSVVDIKDVYKVYSELENIAKEALLSGETRIKIASMKLDYDYYNLGCFYSYSPYFAKNVYVSIWYTEDGIADHIEISNPLSAEETKQYFNEVDKKIAYIKSIVNDSMTDEQKALVIHDYFAANSEYIDDSTLNCHMCNGILMYGKGVCQSYATAYMYVMNMLGIDCNLVDSSKMNHVWNVVKIDGKYYQTDLTWDDPVSDKVGLAKHNNFLLNDSELSEDHCEWNARGIVCNSTYYSNAYWRSAVSPVVFYDGYAYYSANNSLKKRNISTGTDNVIVSNEKYENNGLVWNCDCTGLFVYKDYLYFNSSKYIKRYSLKNGGNPERVYAPESKLGFVVGCRLDGDSIEYATQTDLNDGSTYSKHAIDISGTERTAGWKKQSDGKWYYYDLMGVLVKNEWIDEYYVKSDGSRAISEWVDSGYYVGADGKKVMGWQTISGKRYYFDETTGALKKDCWIDGYYLKSDGAMAVSEWVDSGYYVGADGKKVTGWQTISGKRYYFDKTTGALKKDCWIDGYYLKSDGAMAVSEWVGDPEELYEGWVVSVYYFDKNGEKATGWQTIDGKSHYFDNDGTLKRYSYIMSFNGENKWLVYKIDNDQYCTDMNHVMLKGWNEIGIYWYYFDKSDGKMQKNCWIDNKYLMEDGRMAYNGWITCDNGKRRRVGEDGTYITGWFEWDSKWYYADNDGYILTDLNDFQVTLSQSSYTYDGKEKRPSVSVKIGERELELNVDYTVSYSDNVSEGTATVTISGIGNYSGNVRKIFTISASGVNKGWKKIYGVWYYFNDSGVKQTGWQKLSGTWYYFNSSGAMQTGWQKLSGTWYYFNSSGAMQTGWQKLSGTWYYFNSSGAMQIGWQKLSGIWYYFNNSGAMQTGWQKLSGTWYYFNGSGAMQTGWQKLSGTWYYFNNSGAMQTGWQKISNKWYYFENSGAMVSNKWIGNYYLKSDGSMATSEWIGKYYVGADGAWVKTA